MNDLLPGHHPRRRRRRAGVRADVGLESGVRSAAVAAKRHRGAGRPYICMPQRPTAAGAAAACLLSACVIELEQNKEEQSRVERGGEGRQMLSGVSGHCHCDAADWDWAAAADA